MKIEKLIVPVDSIQILSEDEDILLAKMQVMNTKESRLVKVGDDAYITLFTLDGIKDAVPTLFNKPIVYIWNNYFQDFTGHATSEYEETMRRIAGVIPESCEPTIVTNEDGISYLEVIVALWKKYAPEACERVINNAKNGNSTNVSMEIKVVEYEMEVKSDGNPRVNIEKFKFHGVSLLGENVTTGMVDAKLQVAEFSASEKEDYSNIIQKTNESVAAMFSQIKVEVEVEVDDGDKGDEKQEDKKEEDEQLTNEENKEDIKTEGEGKMEGLLKSQVIQILENAVSEQKDEHGRGKYWVEDYDDEYVYVTDKTDNYTIKRAPYVLDTTNLVALIDFDKLQKVIRGGYLVVKEEGTNLTFAEAVKKVCEVQEECAKTKKDAECAQTKLSEITAKYETLLAECKENNAKLAEYEAKDKKLADEKAKDIVTNYSQYITEDEIKSLQAFYEEVRDLEKLEEKAKALSFSALMAKKGVDPFKNSDIEFTGSNKIVNIGEENSELDGLSAIQQLRDNF